MSDTNNFPTVEFPKRTKFLAIFILVLVSLLTIVIMEFCINGEVSVESIFNEFTFGGLIGLILSASFIVNPFSRKCWI